MTAAVWDDARLEPLRRVGDREADDVVAAYFDEQTSLAPRDLVRQMAFHAQLPDQGESPALQKYFGTAPAKPAWVDDDTIERGQHFFERWLPQIGTVLFCASLPEAYDCKKGVQVLWLTGRLATDTERRIFETAQMIVDAMTVGGLAQGAPGWNAVRHVRLMHAGVRHLIEHEPKITKTADETVWPRWDPAWGTPVNQEDLLGTLMTFSALVIDGLERFGIDVDGDDAEAYMHAWSYIGFLLGIADGLPIDLSSGRELLAAVRRRQRGPSAAGRDMTKSLVRVMRRSMPFGGARGPLRNAPPAVMRFLVDAPCAADLGVPRAPGNHAAFEVLRRFGGVMAAADKAVPVFGIALEQLGRWQLNAVFNAKRTKEGATFSIPTRLEPRLQRPVRKAVRKAAAGT